MKKQETNNTPAGSQYLGWVIQMGIFIFIATYGGIKLDSITGNHHIFVILFSLLSVAFSLYYFVLKASNKKNDE